MMLKYLFYIIIHKLKSNKFHQIEHESLNWFNSMLYINNIDLFYPGKRIPPSEPSLKYCNEEI